jgi:hypothetical protein
LDDVAGCEADVLKGSRPAAAKVANPPVFDVARDYPLGGEGGAEMPDMREVILGSPETAMDNEEQRERSFTVRKSELGELVGIIAISDPQVESR